MRNQTADVNAYSGPVTATLPLSCQFVYHYRGRWAAFALRRPRPADSDKTWLIWMGVVQARDADEVYVCAHAHRSLSGAERCANREADRRAEKEFDLKEVAWRERLGLDEPVKVEPLSITRTLEEARRLGYLVTRGPEWSSPLDSLWWLDCEQRFAPYVVVNLQRGGYARVHCDLLTADVSRMPTEQQKPWYWLTRDFTAIGGHHWYGVTSGSDRCPRDRAAELAVRLAALGREVIAGASVRPVRPEIRWASAFCFQGPPGPWLIWSACWCCCRSSASRAAEADRLADAPADAVGLATVAVLPDLALTVLAAPLAVPPLTWGPREPLAGAERCLGGRSVSRRRADLR